MQVLLIKRDEKTYICGEFIDRRIDDEVDWVFG
jgi:hypothetical protein